MYWSSSGILVFTVKVVICRRFRNVHAGLIRLNSIATNKQFRRFAAFSFVAGIAIAVFGPRGDTAAVRAI